MAGDEARALDAALGKLARLAKTTGDDTQSFEQAANVKKQRFDQATQMLKEQADAYAQVPFVPMGENQPGQDPFWGPVTDMHIDERVRTWNAHTQAVAQAMNRALLSGAILRVWAGVGAQVFGLAPASMKELRTWVGRLGAEARVQKDSLRDIIAEDASLAAVAVTETAEWIHREGKNATNWQRYVAIYRQGVVDGIGRAPESLGTLELHLTEVVNAVVEVKNLASGWGDDLGDAARR